MNEENLKKQIFAGKIFIYPTDTIYGIGCDATNKEAVNKIREIKQRDSKPFSIIAPSINWIKESCIIDKGLEINKYLPGPYTIILKKKNPAFLSWVSDTDSLGVRIPDNDFCKKIQKSGVPFITTSVNLSGEPFAINMGNIKEEIKNKVDFIIDEGELNGKPSTLIIDGKETKR
ncbi:MAG: L-threonylcarbamoyladenylate synthase [Nanoarchaeota archaeon]|nr:L-threonylcarbamoyladenylate synthase [Nanoarchaeota archaeon]